MNYLDYLGIEYSEYNCYELLRLVYEKELGIILPNFQAEKIINERVDNWIEIESDFKIFDVLLFSRGNGRHVGIVVGDNLMLHTVNNKNSCVERYDRKQWKNNLISVYRHRNRTNDTVQ